MFDALRKFILDKAVLLQGNGLKARTSRGSLILMAGTIVERVIGLIRNMILARVLAPENFGLMAIVLAVLAVMEAFTDIGIRQSVVYHQEGNRKEYLNVVWWMQIVRAAGIFITVYMIAPGICHFYGKPELLNLLRCSFMVVLFSGFTSPRLHLLDKEFRFVKALCLIQGSSLIGTFTSIGLALYMRNVWALVIGQVGQSAVQCMLSHVFCPFLPSLRIDRKYLSDILGFGRGMAGLAFLTVIGMEADIFVMGKLLPSAQVGLYAFALALAQQPRFLFSQTIGRVLLPAFAEKQNDRTAMRNAVVTILKNMLLIGVPLTILAALGSKIILTVLYGAPFGAVAVPFALLCFATLFNAQAIVLAQVYMGIGMPYLHRRYVILIAVLIISLMYPAVKLYGPLGAASVLLFSHIIGVLAQIIWMKNVIGIRLKDYIGCWWPFRRAVFAN